MKNEELLQVLKEMRKIEFIDRDGFLMQLNSIINNVQKEIENERKN